MICRVWVQKITDKANIFLFRWREQFFPTIAQEFHWELTNNGRLERQYRLEVISDPVAVFTGEFNRIGGYERPRP